VIRPFRYHEPTTLQQAIQLKREIGEEAAYYAGGTELLLVLKEGLVEYSDLINLKSIEGMQGIEVEKDRLRIGALTRHAEIAHHAQIQQGLPVLAEMAAGIGNIRVRASGTLGGNLAFAEPHSDPSALLIALDAVIRVMGSDGERSIQADQFWLGPFETVLEDGEVLTFVEIPLLEKLSGAAYRKFSVSELPTAGVGVWVRLSPDANRVLEARLVVSSVNPVPTRLRKAEVALQGKAVHAAAGIGPEEWAEVAAPDLDPIDDIYGGADYKTHLVGVLIREAFKAAAHRAKGDKGVAFDE
jgi:carbon-monoxide dehydrogenase medium subunit